MARWPTSRSVGGESDAVARRRDPTGSVFGFLGPNGAGKTTTIRMLMGLAAPTSGVARLLGKVAGPASEAKPMVGFLPDVPAFYGWMTAPEYLEFAGSLFGIQRKTLKRRAGELLELTGLKGVKTRVGGFSRGMGQRLGLAQALVNDPELVILDRGRLSPRTPWPASRPERTPPPGPGR